jgi:hypothetical protein
MRRGRMVVLLSRHKPMWVTDWTSRTYAERFRRLLKNGSLMLSTSPIISWLKAIGVLFILGNFLFGNIIEYRIWFELIPLSLLAINIYFFDAIPSQSPQDKGDRLSRPFDLNQLFKRDQGHSGDESLKENIARKRGSKYGETEVGVLFRRDGTATNPDL